MNTLCLCDSSGVAVVMAEYSDVCSVCVCARAQQRQRDFRREVSGPLLISPDKCRFD